MDSLARQGPGDTVLRVAGLTKTYATGLQALKGIDLEIRRGEIFALLGPNGAGKTTLISIICGIVTPGAGTVTVAGHDIVRAYRDARSLIGLVPQELSIFAFETVLATVRFSRGLYGRAPDPAHVERVLRDLSLWDKRNDKILTLSGGMKRRVLIAKALAHEPGILFLDEPTAGVDVELRLDMWNLVRRLRESGVTIILTTHYIHEAEEMADRVGVIHKGELILVEDKAALMKKLGQKRLTLHLSEPLAALPPGLERWCLTLGDQGREIACRFDSAEEGTGVPALLQRLHELGIAYHDLNTRQDSLEDIFVNLVGRRPRSAS
jgi:ABC-2 type transport system ATP-binding protein